MTSSSKVDETLSRNSKGAKPSDLKSLSQSKTKGEFNKTTSSKVKDLLKE